MIMAICPKKYKYHNTIRVNIQYTPLHFDQKQESMRRRSRQRLALIVVRGNTIPIRDRALALTHLRVTILMLQAALTTQDITVQQVNRLTPNAT